MSAIQEWLARTLKENWLFLLVIVGLAGGFLFLRTPASAVASVGDVDAILVDGQPTMLEFYSNT
jgi:hypothetical protein